MHATTCRAISSSDEHLPCTSAPLSLSAAQRKISCARFPPIFSKNDMHHPSCKQETNPYKLQVLQQGSQGIVLAPDSKRTGFQPGLAMPLCHSNKPHFGPLPQTKLLPAREIAFQPTPQQYIDWPALQASDLHSSTALSAVHCITTIVL